MVYTLLFLTTDSRKVKSLSHEDKRELNHQIFHLKNGLTLLELDSSLEMECLSRLVPAGWGEPSREEEECFSRMVGDPSREPCDHSRSPLTGESSRRTFATTSSFELWCFSLTEPADTRNIIHLFPAKDLVYSYWIQRQNRTMFHGLNCLLYIAMSIVWNDKDGQKALK